MALSHSLGDGEELETGRAWLVPKVLIFQRVATSGRRRAGVLEVVASLGAHLRVRPLTATVRVLAFIASVFQSEGSFTAQV